MSSYNKDLFQLAQFALNNSTDSIAWISKDARILYVNDTACKLLGYSRAELLKKTVHDIDPAYTPEVWRNYWKELRLNGSLTFETIAQKKDGTVIPMEITANYFKHGNDEYEFMFSKDISRRKEAERQLMEYRNHLEDLVNKRTVELSIVNQKLKKEIDERKRTEKELRESEERYQKLLETANDAIFIADAESGIILNANRKAGELLGIPPEKIIGMHQKEMHAKEDEAYYRKLFLDNAQKEGGIILDDIFVWHKNGYRVPVEISSSAVKIGGKFFMQGIFRDITNRKEAEEKLLHNQEQLRSLASQLTKVEELERRNIASYLHDHLGQQVFAMKLQLEQLKRSLPANDHMKTLESAIEITNQMMSDIRSISYNLSPPILYEFGLETALEWMVEEMRTLRTINITFNDDGQVKPLDETTKVLLFQAARELLNNVIRHAKAKNVETFVGRDDTMVVIRINDDGIGFEGSELDTSREKNQGFGLYSIKERLRYIGGDITIQSACNSGTRITLKAPLEI